MLPTLRIMLGCIGLRNERVSWRRSAGLWLPGVCEKFNYYLSTGVTDGKQTLDWIQSCQSELGTKVSKDDKEFQQNFVVVTQWLFSYHLYYSVKWLCQDPHLRGFLVSPQVQDHSWDKQQRGLLHHTLVELHTLIKYISRKSQGQQILWSTAGSLQVHYLFPTTLTLILTVGLIDLLVFNNHIQ